MTSTLNIMIRFHWYLNPHYDFYRTIKIISGIVTMIYSAVNHSYDFPYILLNEEQSRQSLEQDHEIPFS